MINILLVIFFSSFKFAFTFPYAVTSGFGFWETMLWCNIGGVAGILFFGYLSEMILNLWRKYFRKEPVSTRKKKIFSRNN